MLPESSAPDTPPATSQSLSLWQRLWLLMRPQFRRVEFWLITGMIGLILIQVPINIALGRFYPFELFTHFQVQYNYIGWALLVSWVGYRLGRQRKLHWLNLLLFYHFVLNGVGGGYALSHWRSGEPAVSVIKNYADIRVFHANVLYTRTDYIAPITLIQQQKPDLYVLQEMTPASIRHVTGHLKTEYPYWFACWSKGPCWILVGSRTPFRVDEPLARQKRIIALSSRVRGRAMALVTVHPRTPILPSWFAERNEQLAVAAHKTRYNPLPTLLIGDFNVSIFSPIYNRVFDRFKITPDGTRTGKIWALDPCRRDFTQPTWPRFFPPLMIPIDHAFVNNGFRPVRFHTLDLPQSDHRAVVADVNFVK